MHYKKYGLSALVLGSMSIDLPVSYCSIRNKPSKRPETFTTRAGGKMQCHGIKKPRNQKGK